MSVLGAIIIPYPPLIIITMGCGQEREVRALRERGPYLDHSAFLSSVSTLKNLCKRYSAASRLAL